MKKGYAYLPKRSHDWFAKRAAKYNLDADFIAACCDMTCREVIDAFNGAPMPMRLKVFLTLYGNSAPTTKTSLSSAIREHFKLPAVEWRRVPEYPHYEVSSDGKIRRAGRLLNPVRQRSGHLKVTLYNGGARGQTLGVHRIVALAFSGDCTALAPYALHRNGIADDNRSDNIYWGSQTENMADMKRHASLRRTLNFRGFRTQNEAK